MQSFDPERLGRDSATFSRRLVELEPGQELPLCPGAWADAIVFVTAGEIELGCVSGQTRRFAFGAVLCLSSLVRVVRNDGAETARLMAISRRTG